MSTRILSATSNGALQTSNIIQLTPYYEIEGTNDKCLISILLRSSKYLHIAKDISKLLRHQTSCYGYKRIPKHSVGKDGTQVLRFKTSLKQKENIH